MIDPIPVELARRTWAALVHHPVYDRNRRVVTSAITNLDIHDIARSVRTFGLAGYLIVTPVDAQRDLATRILGHWQDESAADAPRNAFRREALARVHIVASIEEAQKVITAESHAPPTVVATAARALGRPALSFPALIAATQHDARPLLLLFGTGWGLAAEVVDRVDHLLTPIRGYTDYNHLSVRSAVAIVLDRLFGDHVVPTETGARES